MSDDTRRGIRGARGEQAREGQLAELGLPLEELVRRGARDILQRAIEAQLEQLLEEFAAVSLIDGRRAVVRNGYLPAREILTTVGAVEVQVPKVRDRSGSGVKFNSALAPPYVRRSARVAAALPWLYLKGISSGDLGEALEVLSQGALSSRPGSPQGGVQRGVQELGGARPRGPGIRLLVGRRHLHDAARERRSQALPAGDHRGHRRWHQGVGGHQRWAA